jgi:tRNA nucleotidyltransferase (CCA-adding enzyme)
MSEERLLAALATLPGGGELIELSRSLPGEMALVGGAVRDLLLEREPRELDVVADGDGAERLACELARRLAGELSRHERFGTASVSWPEGRVDVATRRAESYPEPGALPEVRPGTRDEDLQRRDFTINALELLLSEGRLVGVAGALEDLAGERLRVLHARSFLDDPTRLLRLARYQARLRFQIEPRTLDLARQAVAVGALLTVSGARIGAELRLALGERDPTRCMRSLDELGVLAALGLASSFPRERAREALALLPEDGSAAELTMALLGPTPEQLDRLEFGAGERDRICAGARLAPQLADRLAGASRPSELHEALARVPIEAVALAGALAAEQGRTLGCEAAARWIADLRHVRLEIGGDDLIAAGLSPGPEIGRRLEMTLARKLDGELDAGREAELAAALEWGR